MKNQILYCLILLLLSPVVVNAQDANASYNERARQYISQYYPLAIAEQRSSGIPASITLGQGILETEAGASELMTLANNHFGIKCSHGWQGETMAHDDETSDECFRKYKCAADSYRDHSDHLRTNPRYKPLFSISQTDYAAWAVCLKKCGYATNPQYAKQLIKIIEDFKLQEYTYSALDSSKYYPVIPEVVKTIPPQPATSLVDTLPIADDVPHTDTDISVVAIAAGIDTADEMNTDYDIDSSKIVMVNGMKAFYVHKDENLLPYAVKYKVRYGRLLEINDLPDAPAPFNTYVYLEKKLTYGIHENHMVADWENLLMIAQAEGMQLKKIMALNKLNPGEEPLPGTVLQLQKEALRKPDVKIINKPAIKENTTAAAATIGDPTPHSDYIAIDSAKAADTDYMAEKTAVAPRNVPKPIATAKPAQQPATGPVKKVESKKIDAAGNNVVEKETQKPVTQSHTANLAKPHAVKSEYVTIRRGETLFSIADKNDISVKQLETWNHLKAGKIKIGQKIRINAPHEDITKNKSHARKKTKYYVIKKGETLFAIAKKNNISVEDLREWNNIKSGKIKTGQKLRVSE